MIDYLRMFEASFNTFPGFEVEIQGVYREMDATGGCGSIPMWSVNRIASGRHGDRKPHRHPPHP